ncbi:MULTISPECIES: type II secretion system protein M [unclassified Shewanella]|uniref:type II secretion system protein M n=1 Tax=unclassified Shewanella TaxID=196818 RepID=UPI000C817C23|nr:MULTISPECIES: type II secretion system protein M [unclassified Shewanella]MDO6619613.1 type II secretion system protein M [Shewanella sp. 6_MG-2023]MDO6640568.1 type II secretion system protein M [Shewanella sp. 5_MG-2023]MDO6678701.1 type II secretion system protein M [Shewanella sp. 4_MG-2023]MDO6775717.1 type II secretion system protein M [Shewanella sp. 3_MG-2023]PMG29107.1 general secretion pathway protein GspM [Shewanella sp. 10N.286.52.C2]
MENLQIWWRGLAQREQQLVGSCAVFVVIGILYWGIWSPIATAADNAEKDHQAAKQTLNYVKQSANKIAGLKQQGSGPRASGSLSSIVNQLAGQYDLDITRMQPQGNKIQLWMDDVPFDSLLDYLHELVEEKGLTLESVDVSESDLAGYVKVRRIQLSK